VVLGDSLDDQGTWALRISEKPFVRWIWLGCLIMAVGGLLSATDRRYRLQARRALRVPPGSALGRAR
jgi:cytochrome c-type biogenesis protein CcmF